MAASPDLSLPNFFLRSWFTVAAPGSVALPALVNALPTLTPFERLALLQRFSICCSPAAGVEPLGAALLPALNLLRNLAIAMSTDTTRDLQVGAQMPAMKEAALKATAAGHADAAAWRDAALDKAFEGATAAMNRL